jgi:hypothetical protein
MSIIVTHAGSAPGAQAPLGMASATASAAVVAAAVALLVFSESIAVSFGLIWPLSSLFGTGLWLSEGSLVVALLASTWASGWLFRRTYRTEKRMAAGLEP